MNTYAAITQLTGLYDCYAINDSGVVLGTEKVTSSGSDTFVPVQWHSGSITELVSASTAYQEDVHVSSVNAAGTAVGYESPYGAISYDPFFTQKNSNQLLPLWGQDDHGVASGINDKGQIVGYTSKGPTGGSNTHAVLWQNNSPSLLSTLAANSGAEAIAINQSGAIAGNSIGSQNFGHLGSVTHAVIWQNGVVSALPTVLANQAASMSFGINDAGDAIYAVITQDENFHAASWRNGIASLLPTPSGYSQTYALGLNLAGQIVGEAITDSDVSHAMLWQNGGVIDLNSLLPPGSGWVLMDASAINDNGEIVGIGTHNGTGATYHLSLDGTSAALSPSIALSTIQSFQKGTLGSPASLTDSASDINLDLDGLQSVFAGGKLSTISLTDGGVPILAATPQQSVADSGALKAISTDFTLMVTSTVEDLQSATVDGLSDRGTVMDITNGNASDFSVAASGDAVSLTLSGDGQTAVLHNVTELEFADYTAIIASKTPATAGGVSSFQVAAIYSAVLDRVPDVAGLAYYESYAAANPSVSLLTYAEWFLQSPEYTSNIAHAYAQTSSGEAQFITDTYHNLLHRTPGSAEIAYYQTEVVDPIIAGATPGTSGYANAELHAHALLLTYFASSSEFQNDVQVTAQQPIGAQHWLVLI